MNDQPKRWTTAQYGLMAALLAVVGLLMLRGTVPVLGVVVLVVAAAFLALTVATKIRETRD